MRNAGKRNERQGRIGVSENREGGAVPVGADARRNGAVQFAPEAPGTLTDVSALVLTGGDDVDPALDGAAPHPETEPPDRDRDDYEAELLRAALSRDMPVLAICRGLQLFNVVRGGTLIQHLDGTAKLANARAPSRCTT